MNISIIITTHNRSTVLARTLEAFADVSVPEEWTAERMVVDNASTDRSPAVVQNASLQRLVVRYLYEPNKGEGFALNAGSTATMAEILQFNNDDVTPPRNW